MEKYNKRKKCSVCDSNNFIEVLDLHQVPLAGYFPTKEQLKDNSCYPLKLLFCNESKLVQTDSVINPDILFKDYRYMSSIGLSKHFIQVADILNTKYQISGKNILEIGSNDGVLLEPLAKLGANVIGVEPSINISKIAKDKGLNVINDYFNYNNFKGNKYKEKYDLVLANNAFAHIIDIKDVVKGIKHVLKKDGHFVFEVHYLNNLINENQWDNVYHEHIYYYSITALHNLFTQFSMTLIDFEEIPIHSGSIRVTVKNGNRQQPLHLLNKIKEESKTICNVKYLKNYNSQVKQHILNFNSTIKELSQKYNIAGYGASGRANMFCNLTEIDKNIVKFIVDESPERCGRYIANKGIPIVNVDTLKNSDTDLIIIFAWNYSKMIIEKTQFKKFKYLVAFPSIQVVDTYEELKGFDSI
mgnify:CR=1 FL=1|tara:strand:+ start:928 stop:2169 length:1242 start_codon:yes stop_codon:yes gene_type:complete